MSNKLFNCTVFFADTNKHRSTFHNIGGYGGVAKFVEYLNSKYEWNFIKVYEKHKGKDGNGKSITTDAGVVYSKTFENELKAKGMVKHPAHLNTEFYQL